MSRQSTPEEFAFLVETLPIMRDEKNRLVVGSGPLRETHLIGGPQRSGNKVYNFRQVVTQWVKTLGCEGEDVVLAVFQFLMRAASQGDTAACKILLDRFCGAEAANVNVNVGDAPAMSDVERAQRLASILDKARRRNALPPIVFEPPNAETAS